MSSERQRFGVLTGLVVAALVLVLLPGAIEGAAWLVLRVAGDRVEARQAGSDDYVTITLNGLRMFPDANAVPLIMDPVLLWRNEPLATKTQPINPEIYGKPSDWTIANNERGFRGPPLAFPAERRDVFRVLCIGDSITFGFNVDQPYPFARILEERLRRALPGRAIEVINAAVPGWTWIQGLRFLELEGFALDPDVVVIGHGTNDRFFKAHTTDLERLPGGLRGRALRALQRMLFPTNTYRALLRFAAPPAEDQDSPGCEQQIASTGYCRRVSIREIEYAVREIAAKTRARGVDLLVLNLDFMETGAVAGTRAAVEAERLTFLDFVESFAARRRAAADERARALGLAPAGELATGNGAPQRLLFRVHAPMAAGGLSVRGNSYFVDVGPAVDEPMYDDGTHGDELAGDRVYSATLELRPGPLVIDYRYFVDGTPEMQPLPPRPSEQGMRRVRLQHSTRGQVEEFAAPFLMSEQTHPNASGHEVIAARVDEAIRELPSFRAFTSNGAAAR